MFEVQQFSLPALHDFIHRDCDLLVNLFVTPALSSTRLVISASHLPHIKRCLISCMLVEYTQTLLVELPASIQVITQRNKGIIILTSLGLLQNHYEK